MMVQNLLQLLVQFIALGEQIIQFNLAQHVPQGGLRQQRCGHLVVLHLDDGSRGIDHPVVDNRIHFYAHVILGYDYLLGHVNREDPQVEQNYSIDDWNY